MKNNNQQTLTIVLPIEKDIPLLLCEYKHCHKRILKRGAIYIIENQIKIFCSGDCKYNYQRQIDEAKKPKINHPRQKIETVCLVCEKPFITLRKFAQFCSIPCYRNRSNNCKNPNTKKLVNYCKQCEKWIEKKDVKVLPKGSIYITKSSKKEYLLNHDRYHCPDCDRKLKVKTKRLRRE